MVVSDHIRTDIVVDNESDPLTRDREIKIKNGILGVIVRRESETRCVATYKHCLRFRIHTV